MAGVGAGVAVVALGHTAAMGIATTFGVASTGTAISTLSGAAATNAALAWLGGGALAARRAGRLAGRAARRARRLLALLFQVRLDLAYQCHGSSLYLKRAEVCPSARCVVVRLRPPAPPPAASP